MDNLTHTAIGIFLGRAGLNRWTPRAAPILLLAANAPDLDVISAAGGSLSYLNYHRHITHSLVAIPLLAILPVLIVRLVSRQPVRWLGALAASAIGVASHVALDWTNVYGVRLLLSFSSEWFRADITSVVDLCIWSALLLALTAPLLSRLVNAEIGAGACGRSHGRGWAVFGLLFVLLYNGGRWVAHERAVNTLEARLYQDGPPLRVAALPSPWNPLAWRGVVETTGAVSIHALNLTRSFDPDHAAVFRKPDPDPALEAARSAPAFRDFLAFSQFPFFRVTPLAEPEGARSVEAIDLRFGAPTHPRFVAFATVTANSAVTGASFRFGAFRLK